MDDKPETTSDVLEEEIYALIELGYQHGMSDDDVRLVLEKILNDDAERQRMQFKVI